jgi:MFS family permease
MTDVLVADLATVDKRAEEMGWYGVVWGSGMLIAPLIGGFTVQEFGFIQLFVLSTAFFVIALVPGLLVVSPRTERRVRNETDTWLMFSAIRGLLPWYMMLLCYAMIYGVLVSIFPGYANSVGVGPELVGVIFAFFGISRVVLFAMSGQYSRFPEKKILVAAAALLTLGSLIIAIFPTFVGFSASLLMMGAAAGIVFSTTITLISRNFPSDRKGAGMGSFEATSGAGNTVGPLLAGIVSTLTNTAAIFLMTASFGVLMVILICFAKSRVYKPS